MIAEKIKYLLTCAKLYASPIICPSCGSQHSKLLDRKYFVSRLFECCDCALYFRHPSETAVSNREFYQAQYRQADNITTFMPKDSGQLDRFMRNLTGDRENPKNAARIKRVFESLFSEVEDLTVLDYGASWGYITWQLKSFGLNVQGYEISAPRARYGNAHLGIEIKTEEHSLRDNNHIFFSSHVIEHVPCVSDVLALASRLVRPDGFVVIYCPNGSPDYRKSDWSGFHKCWGRVHPNYLNARFFELHYGERPYFLTSAVSEIDALKRWDQKSQFVGDLSGGELLAIARPHLPAG